jgi:lysophospholipase L1-like esterase
LENLDTGVISRAPNAVFLGFGMNDGALTPTQHIKNIRMMIERIWSALPDAEICLVNLSLWAYSIFDGLSKRQRPYVYVCATGKCIWKGK